MARNSWRRACGAPRRSIRRQKNTAPRVKIIPSRKICMRKTLERSPNIIVYHAELAWSWTSLAYE